MDNEYKTERPIVNLDIEVKQENGAWEKDVLVFKTKNNIIVKNGQKRKYGDKVYRIHKLKIKDLGIIWRFVK